MQLIERRKGNDYFRRGDLKQALTLYQRAKSVVDLVEGMTPEDQAEIDTNKATVLLNIAAVHLTNKDYADAAENCSAALVLQPGSVKALIRRAKCFCFMHEYQVSSALQCHSSTATIKVLNKKMNFASAAVGVNF